VCVGFGISKARHIVQLGEVADGAIVGSAIVKRIKAHEHEKSEKIAASVAELIRELLSGAP
jgi:tryptophan synthase alpha chain